MTALLRAKSAQKKVMSTSTRARHSTSATAVVVMYHEVASEADASEQSSKRAGTTRQTTRCAATASDSAKHESNNDGPLPKSFSGWKRKPPFFGPIWYKDATRL